jgi:hypothetical protein
MAAKSRKKHKNKKPPEGYKTSGGFKLEFSYGSLSWRSPQMLGVKSNQILHETSLSNEIERSVPLQINRRCKFRNLAILEYI